MTGHYFGNDYGRDIEGCSMGATPLNCSFFPKHGQVYLGNKNQDARAADAVWWHAPNTCMLPVGPPSHGHAEHVGAKRCLLPNDNDLLTREGSGGG